MQDLTPKPYPLAKMADYATDLRSATQGRGLFTLEFDHYAPVQR